MRKLSRFVFLCAAAAALGSCSFSWENRPREPRGPTARGAFEALVAAARALDERALEDLVSRRFEGDRARLLAAVRADKLRFHSLDLSVPQYAEQWADGGVRVEFAFVGRAQPKNGPDVRLQGRAQWMLGKEDGAYKLFAARGDSIFGIAK